MKKITVFFVLAAFLACSGGKEIQISVSNPLAIDRQNEVVEISPEAVASIKGKYGEQFILTGADGAETAYQITHDGRLIFQASVAPGGESVYTVVQGLPQAYETIACGKHYPRRVDDIAWENDRIAFRTYGPALQASGEQAFGYDIWTKNVPYPVVEDRYNNELDHAVSYHVDHGNGLDYYNVGPTLGCGTSALIAGDGSLAYPYCYKAYEILDNGPLRFTVKLTYHPLTVTGVESSPVETRLLSLDAGSQLNKVEIKYDNLEKAMPVATGIVIHEGSDVYQTNVEKGFMAYADPADPVNGQIFAGVVFTAPLKEAKPVYFPDEEKKQRKANGHVLATGEYIPGSYYTCYFGGGWSKYGFDTPQDWFDYVESYAEKVKNPLVVKVRMPATGG
jgi:hypothetical protein